MPAMLDTALEAATQAGRLLRRQFGSPLVVHQATHHDLKLEVDVQAQTAIERVLLGDFPGHAILGEENVTGNDNADVRWVVDPLDGTVNFYYGIPHYAVSIAAQQRTGPDTWQTVAGVVYDPELDEMFAATQDGPATLNGRPIAVSQRGELSEAILAIGFFKSADTIRRSLADFSDLIHRVRKVRIQGAAALDIAYVACGRYDGYQEYGIKLWDIAAGQLILERAGGCAVTRPAALPHTYDVRMWNNRLTFPAA